jgi:hypothetical protein
MTLRQLIQTADAFFSSKAIVLAGQASGAVVHALLVSEELSAIGLGVELGYSLDRDPVLVLHAGVLYGAGQPAGWPRQPRRPWRVRDLLTRAAWLAPDCSQAPGVPAPLPPRLAAPGADMLLPGQAEVAAGLPPLVGRAFTLARCGELVYGNRWLRSLDAEKFVLASDFGLLPPICAEPAAESFVIEAWPADGSGRRLAKLKDGSAASTTMLHVPFDAATRLRLVDADPLGSARRRTDENLRGVFG